MMSTHLHLPLSHQGGAKVQEAAYVYQELGEKYNYTVRL